VIKVSKDRNKIAKFLEERGISTGVHYLPIYKHPVYRHANADCPVTEKIWGKILTLPLFPDMTNEEIEKIIAAMEQFR
jgi:perosamine synthetase